MLKKIQIKGYKSIREVDLELTAINVLIGANGVGKSNLISFFKLLRSMLQNPGQLQIFIGQSGGANALLFDGAAITPQIQAELNFEINGFNTAYYLRLFHAAGDTFIFAEENCRTYLPISHTLCESQFFDAGHREAKLIDSAIMGNPTAQKIFNLIQNHCAIYQFHNTSETARIRQKWNIDDGRDLREDGSNLASVLLRLRATEPIYYQRIVETLRQITPFFLDFVLEPEPVSHTVLLQWKERNTDLIFSSYQASDGTLRTMALVTLLLQPEYDLPNLLILDEPELGLHPYAINIVGGLINSVSHHIQVILATQSTTLIDCFEPDDIVVVERKDRQSYFKRLDSQELENWLEEYSLSELWNKNVLGGRPSK